MKNGALAFCTIYREGNFYMFIRFFDKIVYMLLLSPFSIFILLLRWQLVCPQHYIDVIYFCFLVLGS